MSNNSELSALTPHEAAGLVGVGVQSIRRWCDWHANHLSSGASPGPGIPRRLNGRDVEVLKQVKDLRYQGLQTEAINAQLAGLTFAVVDNDEQPSADSSELAPVASQEGLQQSPGVIVALEAMQRQIDAIQQANRGRFDTVTVLGIGICIGLLFAVGMIVLAWLYGG